MITPTSFGFGLGFLQNRSIIADVSFSVKGIADNMANVLSLTEREAVVHEHIDDVGGDELPISQGNVDQSLAAAVNQFLTTQDAGADSSSSGAIPRTDGAVSSGFVGNNPVPPPELSTFERHTIAPTFNPGFTCPAPVDAFYEANQTAFPTTAIAVHTNAEPDLVPVQDIERITEKSKGKAVARAKRNSDVKDLILSAYTDLSSDDFSLLICTLWSIWEFRNKKLFRNANPNAGDVVQWANAFLSQYKEAQLNRIDMDPAYQPNVPAPAPQVIAGFSVPMTANIQPVLAEAWALRLALDWCSSVKFPLSNIFSDCQQLVGKVSSRKKDLSALADVVWDIKNSLSHFPNASVSYTPRDNNIHAHQMAKGALGLDEELVWKNNCPSFLFVT
uniref:RNase H type-1 domain-containing protein n=1 Tax=Cannabis sativa TaxID=3483 RepID=A0A803PNT8_CANSA